jgi:hypothetical protein
MTRDEVWDYCKRSHYSAAYAQYAMEHLVCEACHGDAVLPHHIRTRGAGGDDDAANLLSLCADCHRRIHSLGGRRFAFLYPALRGKLSGAIERPRRAGV